jgi:hypothetical protein
MFEWEDIAVDGQGPQEIVLCCWIIFPLKKIKSELETVQSNVRVWWLCVLLHEIEKQFIPWGEVMDLRQRQRETEREREREDVRGNVEGGRKDETWSLSTSVIKVMHDLRYLTTKERSQRGSSMLSITSLRRGNKSIDDDAADSQQERWSPDNWRETQETERDRERSGHRQRKQG